MDPADWIFLVGLYFFFSKKGLISNILPYSYHIIFHDIYIGIIHHIHIHIIHISEMDCTTSMVRRFDALFVYFSFFQKITNDFPLFLVHFFYISPFFGSFFLHFPLFLVHFFYISPFFGSFFLHFPFFLVHFFTFPPFFGSFVYISPFFWFICLHFPLFLVHLFALHLFFWVVFPTNQCVHPSALMLHHPDCLRPKDSELV